MKKFIYSLLVAGAMLGTTSCSDFTDIKPKGMSMLETTSELDLLLNQDMELDIRQLGYVGGNIIYSYSDVRPGFLVENKSLSTLLFGYFDDEASIKRIELLTTSDDYYSDCYSWIGKIANPILTQVESATGTEAEKSQLKSEAYTLRGFAHYLILQKYAKAYNPQTAANDPAVIYLDENDDISVSQPKNTVKECYDLALADVNKAIELDGLPQTAENKQRLCKSAAYAVKAFICMSMQNYTDAQAAAEKALALSGTLYNYPENAVETTNSYGGTYKTSVIDARKDPEAYWAWPDYWYYRWITPATIANIEDGYSRYYLYPKSSDAYLNDPAGTIPGERSGLPDYDSAASDYSCYDNDCPLTSAQMKLIVAECQLRSKNISAAMATLDELRKCRIEASKYQAIDSSNMSMNDAIAKLKQVSFEENIWTGWNFVSLKRWNIETDEVWHTTLSRTIADVTYTLSPTSNLWVFPFPQPARNANPNLTSNTNK